MWKHNISGAIFVAGTVTMLACFAPGAELLKIGMVAPLSGPGADSGRYQIQGAELAIDEVNKAGGVLGRQIELVMEDDQTTNPGGLRVFRKLAAQKDIPGFIGPIRSTEIHAIAEEIQKLGKPVMIGGTDPDLTHMGNPWLFRFRPNDVYSARAMGNYGVTTLAKKKWAIVHSTDQFGISGMKELLKVLNGVGVKPVLVRGYTNAWPSQDATSAGACDPTVRCRCHRHLYDLRVRFGRLRQAS
jgi:branched-chain amino acid transport system substrate-binding protein